MFRIKLCGLTTPEDARAAAEAGAEAVGLNFFAQSPRCITVEAASQIVAALPSGIAKVGVFVDAAAGEIASVVGLLSLDWVQLHGDEPTELMRVLRELCASGGGQQVPRIVRAIACDSDGQRPAGYLRRCAEDGIFPDAVMIDALVSGRRGGTGHLADWRAVAPQRDWLCGLPLILAGGLTPENVAAGIAQVQPHAVDVASGIESAPGVKDVQKMRHFVSEARRGFAAILEHPAAP